ncbi:tyrosine-type recombinase/integrase [Paenibacillus macerans]|uniref:tyrosine-type recombinase/integrase n=1 Tax=Paenibacillus macerans TaxID=44252 RepID=UPI002041B8F6|nr:tyrosine-type recombinase/integrase [Paenibacillus macerans]MCM3699175.1 tyrosine-type recombinase/integrase [Paenibacillus macerans]
MTRLVDLEDDFNLWLISEGIKPQSIRNIISPFREFAAFCAANGIHHAERLNTEIVREYMVWLADRPNHHTGQPLSGATRAKHYDALRRLDQFLRERGVIPSSITDGIQRPLSRKTIIQSFTPDQLQAIIDAVRETRTEQRYKDRMALLLYMLASSGLRINEALHLRVSAIDHNKRMMVVLGKGDKEREVPLSFELSRLVQEYVNKYEIDRDDPLFASRYGKPLQSSSIRDALRRAKKSLGSHLGIDQLRVSPHTFRHTFARLWVVNGGSTIALSRIMGHTSTQMTDKYVRLWGIDLNTAYDTCNPCRDIVAPKI